MTLYYILTNENIFKFYTTLKIRMGHFIIQLYHHVHLR